MLTRNDADRRIMEIIISNPKCELEEVVLHCEGLTWNQVFLAVDRLSRNGELHLTLKRRGVYTLCVPEGIGACSWPAGSGRSQTSRTEERRT